MGSSNIVRLFSFRYGIPGIPLLAAAVGLRAANMMITDSRIGKAIYTSA